MRLPIRDAEPPVRIVHCPACWQKGDVTEMVVNPKYEWVCPDCAEGLDWSDDWEKLRDIKAEQNYKEE